MVASAVVLIGYACIQFKEERIAEGSAYGFSIGQTHDDVFAAAVELQKDGEIEEIHRWPEGFSHFRFGADELPEARGDDRWTMIVDRDLWNDSITLEFRNDALVEIYRFRICCEMP